jgi:hypothetical protein
MGWLLVAAVAIPLALQARALRGRSYQVLSGRTRQAVRRQLSRRGAIAAAAFVALFFVVAIGVPAFGAVSASLLADYGGSFSLTLANYHTLFAQTNLSAAAGGGLVSPIVRSLIYGLVVATITVIAGFIAARLLAQRRTKTTGALDFLLLAAVALPGVVFGAGYIFAYNLPVVSRPIVMAWLFTFCGVFLELPLSQRPGRPVPEPAVRRRAAAGRAGPRAAGAPDRAGRAGHDQAHRRQADLERAGRRAPVRAGDRRGVPRPRLRARDRHQRDHPADRRLRRRPGGAGRDRGPAHGSGRLSPVPGRALEDFGRTGRGACPRFPVHVRTSRKTVRPGTCLTRVGR